MLLKLCIVLVLLWSAVTHAGLPTLADYQALGTDFLVTNAVEFAPILGDNFDAAALAAAYNATRSPDYWIYRATLSKDTVLYTTSGAGTVFLADGNGYMTQSQGERDAFNNLLFDRNGMAFPVLDNVRGIVEKIFPPGSSGNSLNNLNHFRALWRVQATRAQHLFRVNFANGSTATPDKTKVLGTISMNDIACARDSLLTPPSLTFCPTF